MTKCLIFDCDGTLVDSEYLCNLGLVKKLQEYHIDEDVFRCIGEYRGWKLAKVVESLEFKHQVEFESDFVESYRAIVSELFETELKPVPGVQEMLVEISLPKCVASSGPMHKIKEALRFTGLRQYFGNHLFSSYDIQSWKPDPGLFLLAAEAMGYAPEDCVVIEDSLPGLEAALAAKMTPIYYNPHLEPVPFPGVVTL